MKIALNLLIWLAIIFVLSIAARLLFSCDVMHDKPVDPTPGMVEVR